MFGLPPEIEPLFMFGLFILLIFLITRWFWNWYFRINERTELLKKIHKNLYIIAKDIEDKNKIKDIVDTDITLKENK